MLVRERAKRFNVRALLPLVRERNLCWREQKETGSALPLVRESERVLARTKKGLKSAWRDYQRAIMFASDRAG